MKTAIFKGKGRINVENIPNPTLETGEVIVKVKYCGICGSDLEAFKTGIYQSDIEWVMRLQEL